MQLLMILKKGLLTELEKKRKAQNGNKMFWVGRSTVNQHIFKVSLTQDTNAKVTTSQFGFLLHLST